MATSLQDRLRSPWLVLPLLAIVVSLSVIEITRLYFEHGYREVLATEVQRSAFEVTSQTMKGNVMGSVANLGLVIR